MPEMGYSKITALELRSYFVDVNWRFYGTSQVTLANNLRKIAEISKKTK